MDSSYLSIYKEIKETLEFSLRLKFYVFIQVLNKEKIKISIEENSKIIELKEIIRAELKIPVNKQILFFSGVELDDNKGLLYYNIKCNSILKLNLSLVENEYNDNYSASILVKTLTGKVIPIEIGILNKIEDLKTEIEKKKIFLKIFSNYFF